MGANTFYNLAKGKTADEAFRKAVDYAKFQNGHGGYTGTIAEKDEFIVINVTLKGRNKKQAAYDRAVEIIRDPNSCVDDKWGPCGCIKVAKDLFLFFGWASS